jgi:hypothetical protein
MNLKSLTKFLRVTEWISEWLLVCLTALSCSLVKLRQRLVVIWVTETTTSREDNWIWVWDIFKLVKVASLIFSLLPILHHLNQRKLSRAQLLFIVVLVRLFTISIVLSVWHIIFFFLDLFLDIAKLIVVSWTIAIILTFIFIWTGTNKLYDICTEWVLVGIQFIIEGIL